MGRPKFSNPRNLAEDIKQRNIIAAYLIKKKPWRRYVSINYPVPSGLSGGTYFSILNLYKSGEALKVDDIPMASGFQYTLFKYEIKGNKLFIGRIIDYPSVRRTLTKTPNGRVETVTNNKPGDVVYASVMQIDGDILTYAGIDHQKARGEGEEGDLFFQDKSFMRITTFLNKKEYIHDALHEIRMELWHKNSVSSPKTFTFDKLTPLAKKIRAEREVRERAFRGEDYVIDMGISINGEDEDALKRVRKNAVLIYEGLMNDGYHGFDDYSGNGQTTVLHRKTFSSVPYGDKLLCLNEIIWSRGKTECQFAEYGIEDDKIIVDRICKYSVVPMIEVFQMTSDKLTLLGNAKYGTKTAKKGEYLKPFGSQGEKWIKVPKPWTLMKDPTIVPPPCRAHKRRT